VKIVMYGPAVNSRVRRSIDMLTKLALAFLSLCASKAVFRYA
jgi:hypothetical protein